MKKLLTVFALFITLSLAAQDKIQIDEQDYKNSEVEMADQFRADGKIYVVVAVVTVILGGLILYAVSIHRKVSRLEKSVES